MSESNVQDFLRRRLCLTLPRMSEVVVRRDVPYVKDDGNRVMDIYDLPRPTSGPRGAVVIVPGYPDRAPAADRRGYRDIGWTTSMAQLAAASGLVAVTYTTTDPEAGLQEVLRHLHSHAAEWDVDPRRLAVLASSGNAPTALSAVRKSAATPLACAVFEYGCLLDLDRSTVVAGAAQAFGFANPMHNLSIEDLRSDVPLLIVRAGKDQFEAMNASIDPFVAAALRHNLPLTCINHPSGPHAFDLFDDSRAAQIVVRQVLAFLALHLDADR